MGLKSRLRGMTSLFTLISQWVTWEMDRIIEIWRVGKIQRWKGEITGCADKISGERKKERKNIFKKEERLQEK